MDVDGGLQALPSLVSMMMPVVGAAAAGAGSGGSGGPAGPAPSFAPMESGGPYPRVAHRHLYLWVERKANEKGPEAARRVKTIPSLEAFYGEVAAANAGNKHYSPLKLQEMVVRAPPYSLLYVDSLLAVVDSDSILWGPFFDRLTGPV